MSRKVNLVTAVMAALAASDQPKIKATRRDAETHGRVVGCQPVATGEAKVGRNEPCPCGSGKKFKKCCLSNY